MNRALWALTACALVSATAIGGEHGAVQEGQPPKPPAIENELGKAVSIGPGAWEKLPRQQVKVKDPAGVEATYEGVSLAAVLKEAGAKLGRDLRGLTLTTVVLVEGRDGYRVALSVAEIDPDLTDNVVLVADRKDGKPLDDREGPYRLVVPHDKKHSRWVRQVTRITLHRPADPSVPPRKE